MNAVEKLAERCAERKLAWSLDVNGDSYILKVFAAFPIVLAQGSGGSMYAAARQATHALEKREGAR